MASKVQEPAVTFTPVSFHTPSTKIHSPARSPTNTKGNTPKNNPRKRVSSPRKTSPNPTDRKSAEQTRINRRRAQFTQILRLRAQDLGDGAIDDEGDLLGRGLRQRVEGSVNEEVVAFRERVEREFWEGMKVREEEREKEREAAEMEGGGNEKRAREGYGLGEMVGFIVSLAVMVGVVVVLGGML